MESQKKLINETDWDVLIILDACRHDFFEELYTDYLSGKLIKTKSGAINTAEWLVKTFESYYSDVTYFSAMPHVNSLGISLKDTNPNWDYDWKATDYFFKIVDVWDFGWSEKLGAVPPRVLSETVVRGSDEDRKIVHYGQPHVPYLSLVEDSNLSRGKWNPKESVRNEGFTIDFRGWVKKKLIDILGREFTWQLKETLNMETVPGSIEHGWRKGIKHCYKDNLRRGLEEASNLIEKLPGEIVITADHGECLGEEGYWSHGHYGHEKTPRLPVLVEVPWLEVDK